MIKLIKRKKGEEPTSNTLRNTIIVIIGFALILFLLYRLAFSQQIDRSTCHLSVIERGSLPDTLNIKDLIPLKCETRKICVTDKLIGKGDCEKELGANFDTVRVSSDKIKMQEDMNKVLAQEQADCWSMMGEGKIQVFTRGAQNKNRCVVCSRISFDNSVTEKNKEIQGFGKYMISNSVPNQNISYWNYTTSGVLPKEYNASVDRFATTQKAVLFTEADRTAALSMFQGSTGFLAGCYLGAQGGAIFGAFVGLGVGSIVTAPAGGIVGCIGGGILGGLIGKASAQEIDSALGNVDYISGNFLVDYNGEGFKSQNCDSLESVP
ncbi:MAG: hypothetical protein AABW51_01165 [Nanoarchaeota archaeon]